MDNIQEENSLTEKKDFSLGKKLNSYNSFKKRNIGKLSQGL